MSILFGLAGLVLGFFAYDGVDKSSGARVFGFGGLAILCFVISIASIGARPGFPDDDCTRFSSFANPCD